MLRSFSPHYQTQRQGLGHIVCLGGDFRKNIWESEEVREGTEKHQWRVWTWWIASAWSSWGPCKEQCKCTPDFLTERLECWGTFHWHTSFIDLLMFTHGGIWLLAFPYCPYIWLCKIPLSTHRGMWGKPSEDIVPVVGSCINMTGTVSQVMGENRVGPSRCEAGHQHYFKSPSEIFEISVLGEGHTVEDIYDLLWCSEPGFRKISWTAVGWWVFQRTRR